MKVSDRVLELSAATLLSIAALATSWSGYQATLWNGEQAWAAGTANAKRARGPATNGGPRLILFFAGAVRDSHSRDVRWAMLTIAFIACTIGLWFVLRLPKATE